MKQRGIPAVFNASARALGRKSRSVLASAGHFALSSTAAHPPAPRTGMGLPSAAFSKTDRAPPMMSIPTGGARARPATPPRSTRAGMTPAQADFMSQLALQLGMGPDDGPSLVAPRLFTGPAGLACRVHLQEGEPAVRPEALLPMAAQELAGHEVQRLLSVQSLVLSELGWYLTTSPEGLLQLNSLSWFNDPVDAATALDLANGVGLAVIHALMLDDPRLGQSRGLSN
jgi:hypothetical protein